MSPDEDENGMLYFNGVNGDRGGYELEPISTGDLFKIITDETDEMGEEAKDDLKELRHRYEQREIDFLGVKHGVNANDLGEAGWGIIFAHGADPEIKEALSELIELRRAQAGDYFYLYEGQDAYRPGESKRKFLARHGVGPGPADPEKVPYYLLIVGDPETIPYRFQSQLDVQYAVGRIYFESLDEYANYARSVVAAETGQRKSPRSARFFGVANEDDRATQRTTKELVEPLYQKMQGSDPEWDFDLLVRDKATKADLAGLLGGDQTPGLLFTASHGMNFDLGSQNQIPHQGALLCQDWPGPEQWPNPFPQEFYFSAEDIADEADLQGLIAFFFACFGAGTPTLDQFVKRALGHQQVAIAPHNFLARLPMAMLGRSRGGALAVIGHVDRALSYSFSWPRAGVQTTVFESTLNSLMSGDTVGSAVEYFNDRYAELSTVLSDELEDIGFGKEADPGEISGMWAANSDARGYALIGDPAVRLKYKE